MTHRPHLTDHTPTPQDLDTISLQLGRPARDVVEIGARCVCGNPLVATTAPRLSNGIPFPTTFYLTHPVLTAAVSRLEADGVMADMTDRLQKDEDLAAAYRAAHEAYLQERDRIGQAAALEEVTEIRGISAGGMPERVKCLHVLVGHALAAGPGVNPLGDEALERISEWWTADVCRCAGAWDPEAPVPARDLSRHVKRIERLRAQTVAAVDCGTNSIRLLIARATENAADGEAGADEATAPFEDLLREMRVVRLGEGVDATGEFSPEALERTFTAAEEYAGHIQRLHAGTIRFVATSASRDVSNRDAFVEGIRERLGVVPEVISGDEEAALSFAGAVSVLDPTGWSATDQVLVVDLGGGSTEFVTGTIAGPNGPEVTASISTNMGCVRFTERHLHSDPPTAEEVDAATADITTILNQVEQTVPLEKVRAVVGVAGSITTVTAAALGLTAYERDLIHGTELSLAAIDETARSLLAATRAERAEMPFMHPGRVDVIGSGALIWTTLLDRVQQATGGAVTTALTSEHDILDGIALSILP